METWRRVIVVMIKKNGSQQAPLRLKSSSWENTGNIQKWWFCKDWTDSGIYISERWLNFSENSLRVQSLKDVKDHPFSRYQFFFKKHFLPPDTQNLSSFAYVLIGRSIISRSQFLDQFWGQKFTLLTLIFKVRLLQKRSQNIKREFLFQYALFL